MSHSGLLCSDSNLALITVAPFSLFLLLRCCTWSQLFQGSYSPFYFKWAFRWMRCLHDLPCPNSQLDLLGCRYLSTIWSLSVVIRFFDFLWVFLKGMIWQWICSGQCTIPFLGLLPPSLRTFWNYTATLMWTITFFKFQRILSRQHHYQAPCIRCLISFGRMLPSHKGLSGFVEASWAACCCPISSVLSCQKVPNWRWSVFMYRVFWLLLVPVYVVDHPLPSCDFLQNLSNIIKSAFLTSD